MPWPTERSQPMPRPSPLVRALALLGVLGALLAACGGTAPTPSGGAAATSAPAAQATTAPEANVSPKETLIFAGDFTDQLSMDPAVAYEFGGIQVVGSVYQT